MNEYVCWSWCIETKAPLSINQCGNLGAMEFLLILSEYRLIFLNGGDY